MLIPQENILSFEIYHQFIISTIITTILHLYFPVCCQKQMTTDTVTDIIIHLDTELPE